jgi:hypothetical protein
VWLLDTSQNVWKEGGVAGMSGWGIGRKKRKENQVKGRKTEKKKITTIQQKTHDK